MKNQDFEIQDQIFVQGAYALHVGCDKSTQQAVLIKTLAKNIVAVKDVAYLEHEAKILRSLKGSGVLNMLDAIRSDRFLSLVFENYDSTRLSQLITFTHLSLEDKLKIAIGICSGLAQVHNQKVIHKALSPNAILVDEKSKETKIMDFTKATRLSKEVQKIRSFASISGDLRYFSPEQTGRMNRPIDYRSDIYSLGVTLYELFTTVLPFDSSDLPELVKQHLSQRPQAPRSKNSDIPEIISAIILKCIEKSADDRYQSAIGIQKDLEHCLAQLRSESMIKNFPLCRFDTPTRFQVSHMLFGREQEIKTLLSTFESVKDAPLAMVKVFGPSGIGKSSVINEVQKPIVESRGLFATGKFDQFKKNVPYAALAQAFSDLIAYLRTESPQSLAYWKQAFTQNLSEDALVLIDLIPKLQEFIDIDLNETRYLLNLDPIESNTRFIIAVKKLIKILAQPMSPLVLAIDDMQWADSATLSLFATLLAEKELKNFLIIISYRTSEIDKSHPLSMLFLHAKEAGANTIDLELPYLSEKHLNELVCHTLRCSPGDSLPLSSTIYERSAGNPFFASQLLAQLYEDGYIHFNLEQAKWNWQLDHKLKDSLCSNVLDLMKVQLAKLSPACLQIVEMAACMGERFDLNLLSDLLRQPKGKTLQILFEAIERNLIHAPSFDFRVLLSQVTLTKEDEDKVEKHYLRFAHDRIQQAAYQLIQEKDKQQYRLMMARLIGDSSSMSELKREVFEVVGHYNEAVGLIQNDDEMLKVCQLNYQAGQQAKQAAAFKAASSYFEFAISLLQNQKENPLRFDILIELCECQFMAKDYDLANATAAQLIASTASHIIKARALTVMLQINLLQGANADAIECGLRGLKYLKCFAPKKMLGLFVAFQMLETLYLYKTNSAEELLNLQPTDDPEIRYTLKIAGIMLSGLHETNPILAGYFALKIFILSLKHGIIDYSLIGFNTAGVVLSLFMGQKKANLELGEIGIKLCDRYGFKSVKAQVYGLFATTTHHFFYSLSQTRRYLYEAAISGQQSGDLLWANYGLSVIAHNANMDGSVLASQMKDIDASASYAEKTASHEVLLGIKIQQNFLAMLQKDGKAGMAEELLKTSTSLKRVMNIYINYLFKINYILDNSEIALEIAVDNLRYAIIDPKFHPAAQLIDTYCFFSLCLSSSPKQKIWAKRFGKTAKQLIPALKTWAKNDVPYITCRYQAALGAESLRIGKFDIAKEYFDRAIHEAKRDQLLDMLGVLHEKMAELYTKKGETFSASHELKSAYEYFAKWQALSKLDLMAAKYTGIFGDLSKKEEKAG